MGKKGKKTLITIGSVIAIGALILAGLNAYLDTRLEKLDLTELEHTYGNQRDYVLEKSQQSGNLILLGSSELSSEVQQNPKNMFPNQTISSGVTLDGVAYVQSLLHSMDLAAIKRDGTANKSDTFKLAIVVSLQWFYNDDIDKNGYAANFSKIQFYDYMYNKGISRENKQYVCQRTQELLKTQDGFEDVKVFTKCFENDNIISKIMYGVLSPYYKAQYEILCLQDKYQTYKTLMSNEISRTENNSDTKHINWEKEEKVAQIEGAEAANNNDFFVDNEYYDTYLRENINSLKNSSSDEKLQSKEKEDFKNFLSTCRDLNIEPYIIMMNTNGRYYDYIGMNTDVRTQLYSWVNQEASKYGYEVLTLEEKEYEPYFMHDVMHLGWKGWLYVDKKITEHYSGQ